MNKRATKKIFRPITNLLFFLAIALLYLGWSAGTLLGFSPIWKVVEGVPKNEVVQDDDDVLVGTGRKANVLFLLDTGSQMTFTPVGTMPEWNVNVTTRAQADALLAQSTYGHGGLNVVGTTAAGKERYGRDLDASNNATLADMSLTADQFMAKHINNYYFPFNNIGNPLNSLVANANSYVLPYALVFKQQSTAATALAYWRGTTKPTTQAALNAALMPNDSRMYKMKLVMWRLLDDSTLFERLRIGMATTFQEFNVRTSNYIADFYKASPFGAPYTYSGYTFQNGTGPDWATSIPGSNGYGNSQACYWGIDRDYYDTSIYGYSTPTWRLINRAYLRVPISDYSTDHAKLFRMWIDGYEDVSDGATSDPYFFKNPELIADGKTFLSTAIFPGHSQLSRTTLLNQTDGRGQANCGIAFSHRTAGTNFTTSVNATTRNNCMNVLKGGTGEALGTVLDFFSPPVSGIGGAPRDAYNVKNAPAVSFPIKDNCESNWLIIFTAGDDSSGYNTADAVLSLFKETKNKKVTRRTGQSGNNNTFEEVQLDDGVRTIVVGFVDPASTAANVVTLRTKLNAIAQAGDPRWNGSDWVADTSKHAYFANDVPGLMEVLREILVHINAEIRPAKGPMTESASLETTSVIGDFDLFSASYKVNNEDQWQGELVRYMSNINASGDITMTLPGKWELGATLMNLRAKNNSGRKLVYWNGSGYSDLDYSTGSSEYSPVAGLLGLETGDLKTPSIYGGKLHPSRAMINWLRGYDYNYATNKEVERKFMLSDFGQSGVAMVRPPTEGALSLAGHDAWATSSAMQSRSVTLFAQSNEGILHVIDPTATGSGLEVKAIVPPPVMQPFRLAATKFAVSTVGTDKKVEWDDNTIVGDAGYGSRPAYLLDGPLFLRDFDLDQSGAATGWGTYLIGMLGRAGNGLYLMNVTDPRNPKFLWYRETRYQSDGRPVLITMDGSAATPTHTQDTSTNMGPGGPVFTSPNNYPFYQMGYNMPRPVAGVAKFPDNSLRNMIVLAGGMQENLDLNNNGYVGAALYVVDPKNGYQPLVSNQKTRVFNSGSLSAVSADCRTGTVVAGPDPYMGMLVTPPALLRSGTTKSITGKIFTADNRGNIFMINLENGFGTSAVSLAENDWSIQTIGTLRAKAGESNADDNHSIPLGILVSSATDTGDVWVSGGTSNIGTRNNDNTTSNSAMIRNKGQYIFSLMVSADKALYRDDLVPLGMGTDTAPEGSNGWHIKLQAETPTYGEEYVTTRPVLMGGKIYCTTFIPKKLSATCSSAVDGTSRVYAVSLQSGEDRWTDGAKQKLGSKYIEIRGVKFAGLTHSKKGARETILGSYFVTNTAEATADINKLVNQGTLNEPSSTGTNSGVLPLDYGEGDDPPFPPRSTFINYWREVF